MEDNFSDFILRTLYIFEGNYWQFKHVFQDFSQLSISDEYMFDERKSLDLYFQASQEISRLFHNYVSAWFSQKEHTSVIHKKLKKSEKSYLREFAIEYQERLDKSIKKSTENIFINDLRRYIQHKAIPPLCKIMTLNNDGASVSLCFDSDKIKDFDWKKESKEYILSRQNIHLDEIVDSHFCVVKKFHEWIYFRDLQLSPYNFTINKHMSFEEWLKSNEHLLNH
ncbi:MAG: hypothetical protein HC852_09075 [Acaryochloridaceae cyanobacterium RU_4_10]|nr:hypothetical protein [Acaryochloridaceae cyanobacterium RU_4_10]